MIEFLVLLVIFVAVLVSTVFIVQQQTVVIIERFGKFKHTKTAGIHIRAPFGIDRIVSKVNMRIIQDSIQVETKTKDNVFVLLDLAVQFKVDPRRVADSYYQLSSPVEQIRSYIEDAIRSALPTYNLDEAYEKKDEIAHDVFGTVFEEMGSYGYVIVKTLITSIEPDAKVKNSMNEINAAQRQRVAAQELANADKIKVVTAAEAEAEKDRLHGVGVAEQRQAIVDGLSKSFDELKTSGLSEKEIMSILLTNQYLDTLNNFASGQGNNTMFLPSRPDGITDIQAQILSALEASKGQK